MSDKYLRRAGPDKSDFWGDNVTQCPIFCVKTGGKIFGMVFV